MNRNELTQLKLENKSNKIVTNLINVIIGEYDLMVKKYTAEQLSNGILKGDEITTIISKLYKSNVSTISLLADDNQNKIDLNVENKFLEQFLPKQLSKDDIITIVQKLYQEDNNIKFPMIMKYLSTNYKGQYEGNVARTIINETLLILQ